MRKELEAERSRSPVLRRMMAGLVLVAVAAIAVWVVIGIIKTILVVVVAIAAVLAIGWAIKTLVW